MHLLNIKMLNSLQIHPLQNQLSCSGLLHLLYIFDFWKEEFYLCRIYGKMWIYGYPPFSSLWNKSEFADIHLFRVYGKRWIYGCPPFSGLQKKMSLRIYTFFQNCQIYGKCKFTDTHLFFGFMASTFFGFRFTDPPFFYGFEKYGPTFLAKSTSFYTDWKVRTLCSHSC